MGVKLHVDLETLQLIQGPGQRSTVYPLRFKRGDTTKLQVVFLENGITPVTIGNADTLEIEIGIKQRNQFDQSYLAHSADWTMPSEGDDVPTYECALSLNTLQLNSALNVDSPTLDRLPEITLMGEITWREGAGEPTSTRTFLVVVENDVNRGDEGVPTDANPSYPIPGPAGPQGSQGEQGPQGPQGEQGLPGSDATVTPENITLALGYTPADSSDLADYLPIAGGTMNDGAQIAFANGTRIVQGQMASAPTATDDETKGFVAGSVVMTDAGYFYDCASATEGNAVWNLRTVDLSGYLPLTGGLMTGSINTLGHTLFVDEIYNVNYIAVPTSGGTLALTSDIPDVSAYLQLAGGVMTGAITNQYMTAFCDVPNGCLVDSASASVEWVNHRLVDTGYLGGTYGPSVDWHSRKLYANDGTTEMINWSGSPIWPFSISGAVGITNLEVLNIHGQGGGYVGVQTQLGFNSGNGLYWPNVGEGAYLEAFTDGGGGGNMGVGNVDFFYFNTEARCYNGLSVGVTSMSADDGLGNTTAFDYSGIIIEGVSTVNAYNRVLIDAAAQTSIDWHNRRLYATDGVTQLLNWSGGGIIMSQGINDYYGYKSVDTENRQLRDLNGNPVLTWVGNNVYSAEFAGPVYVGSGGIQSGSFAAPSPLFLGYGATLPYGLGIGTYGGYYPGTGFQFNDGWVQAYGYMYGTDSCYFGSFIGGSPTSPAVAQFPNGINAFDGSNYQQIVGGDIISNAGGVYSNFFADCDGTGPASVPHGVKFIPTAYASLPSSAEGTVCYVNDADTPAVGSAVVGGGSAKCLVCSSGSDWKVIALL